MNIPTYARYKFATNKAFEFLFAEKITSFPLNPFQIIKQHKWAIVSYSELSKKHNCAIEEICNAFESEDGYTQFNGRNYTIAYNDTKIQVRIYFTLIHEIAHILLHHFIDFSKTIILRSNLSKSEYKVLENEANCFSRNAISPAILAFDLNLNSNQIGHLFFMSEKASTVRKSFVIPDIRCSLEENLEYSRKQFREFEYNCQKNLIYLRYAKQERKNLSAYFSLNKVVAFR